jgi:hypothetical protein
MQARLHGPQRETEPDGNFFAGQFVDIAQFIYGAKLRLEGCYSIAEQLPHLCCGGKLLRSGCQVS